MVTHPKRDRVFALGEALLESVRESLRKREKLKEWEIAPNVREYKHRLESADLEIMPRSLDEPSEELANRDEPMQLWRVLARAMKFWLTAVVPLAMVADVGGLVALQQLRQAQEQAQDALAQSDYLQAVALVNQVKYSEALPFLARSLRAKPSGNPAASLAFDLMMYQPQLLAVMPSGGEIGPAFSPDGTEIMTTMGKTVFLWDARTGRPFAPPIEHPNKVRESTFSRDGMLLATVSVGSGSNGAGDEVAARVWDAKTGRPVTPPLPVKYSIDKIRFSPDGADLIAFSSDYSSAPNGIPAVQSWNVKTGQLIALPYLSGPTVRSIAFSGDGTLVATSYDYPNGAVVWNTRTGKPLLPQLNIGVPSYMVFGPEGTRLMTIGDTAQVWDLKTGQSLTGPLEFDYRVQSAEFSQDGNRVQLISGDNEYNGSVISIKAWTIKTGKPWGHAPATTSNISEETFSPDGMKVATISGDGAEVWNAETGQPITPPLKRDDLLTSIDFSPDSTRVVTASSDRTAQVWDARNGKPLTSPLQHDDGVNTAVFSPDGTEVLTTANDDTVRVWDARTLGQQASWLDYSMVVYSPDGMRELIESQRGPQVLDARTGEALSPRFQLGKPVYFAAFSPDGTRLVTRSDDKIVRVWNALTGQMATQPIAVGDLSACTVFSPDGTRLFVGSSASDGTQKIGQIWSVQTGRPIGSLMKFDDLAIKAAFSSDGRELTTATDNNAVQVWNATTGQPETDPVQLGPIEVGFTYLSPDGRFILKSTGRSFAIILDSKTGQPVTPPLQHMDYVRDGTFSSDGSRVATCSRDGMIKIWDARTGELLAPPITPSDGVKSISFSPDGKRLVSWGGSIQVWDAINGQPLTIPLQRDALYADSVTFTPDGLHLIEVDSNTIRTTDLAPVTDPPAWFCDLLEASAFGRLNRRGVIESVPSEKILEIKRERLASTSSDQWEVFGRWLFSEPTSRTISPWSKTTLPEFVQKLIWTRQLDSLRQAIALSYGHPDWQNQAKAKILEGWSGIEP